MKEARSMLITALFEELETHAGYIEPEDLLLGGEVCDRMRFRFAAAMRANRKANLNMRIVEKEYELDGADCDRSLASIKVAIENFQQQIYGVMADNDDECDYLQLKASYGTVEQRSTPMHFAFIPEQHLKSPLRNLSTIRPGSFLQFKHAEDFERCLEWENVHQLRRIHLILLAKLLEKGEHWRPQEIEDATGYAVASIQQAMQTLRCAIAKSPFWIDGSRIWGWMMKLKDA